MDFIFCPNNFIGRINSIHERCIHFIQQNYASDFEVLPEMQMENQSTKNA